ncbi:MAG TPA: class II aldolase/adducin family protein [Candidatus Binatia bacterium]|nr:class II aldolase/adducin family protein [Candidatus Binatia bacterium]
MADELKELLALSCRILGKLNMTKEPSGHVSARVPGTDKIFIKARGRGESGLRFVTARDFITVDAGGKKLEGPQDLDVPQEVYIHTAVYRARPEVQSIIHVHPLTVVLFTICDVPLLPLTGAYDPSALRLITEGVPTYPRSILISNEALGNDLAGALGKQRACLMRGHGITAAGTSVQDVTLTAIKLNEIAEVNYRARLLGEPRPISSDDIKSFLPTHERMKASGAYVESAWRYYCTLLDEPVISPGSDKSSRG